MKLYRVKQIIVFNINSREIIDFLIIKILYLRYNEKLKLKINK